MKNNIDDHSNINSYIAQIKNLEQKISILKCNEDEEKLMLKEELKMLKPQLKSLQNIKNTLSKDILNYMDNVDNNSGENISEKDIRMYELYKLSMADVEEVKEDIS